MKKLALGLLSLFLVVGSVNAQTGKKALKKGQKLLQKYGENAVTNADVLEEGLSLIASAMEDEKVASEAKNYNTLASAYSAVIGGQVNAKLIDPAFVISNADVGMKALEAYAKAIEMNPKKAKKDALKGLAALESHLNNVGIYAFQEQDYGTAFTYFNEAITAYDLIKANGGDSRLDDEVERKDHFFYTGAAGYYGKKGLEAAPVLEKLAAEGTDKGLVYEALFSIYSETDKEKSVGYLEKGREMFPDDTGLLFAEINYYLAEGKLDVLTDKLKAAIEKEPDNVSIYTTLGNVYDQLTQSERAAGNEAKSQEYFDLAFSYYGQALEKDPTNFDAVYSQGALFYNKAASLTDPINELANDFSAEGTKKYDALKAEMDGLFGEALPYFLKAEGMNAKDLNTLIALKEIYARQDKLDKVGEIKARIETIQAGGE